MQHRAKDLGSGHPLAHEPCRLALTARGTPASPRASSLAAHRLRDRVQPQAVARRTSSRRPRSARRTSPPFSSYLDLADRGSTASPAWILPRSSATSSVRPPASMLDPLRRTDRAEWTGARAAPPLRRHAVAERFVAATHRPRFRMQPDLGHRRGAPPASPGPRHRFLETLGRPGAGVPSPSVPRPPQPRRRRRTRRCLARGAGRPCPNSATGCSSPRAAPAATPRRSPPAARLGRRRT